MDKKTIEIPFGAKDSELYKFEYTIPDGYEAKIKDGKVIVKKKESEDEKIRKSLVNYFTNYLKNPARMYLYPEVWEGMRVRDILAYLERQKDITPIVVSNEDWDRQMAYNEGYLKGMADSNKPAEWSEKEKMHLYNAIEAVKYVYDISEGTSGFKCVEFLKSLRPQSHWKPSEEQMCELNWVSKLSPVLESLYKDIKKLM